MIFIHPNTQHVFVCSEQCNLTAEIDRCFDNSHSVMIGDVGYANSLYFLKEDWPGFMDLVKQIDEAWNVSCDG